MVRSGSALGLVVLLSAGVAYGQGEVVSFYVELESPPSGSVHELVPIVPGTDGFVVTDIYTPGVDEFTLLEVIGQTETTIFSVDGGGHPLLFQLNSGLVFESGSSIKLHKQNGTAGTVRITLSGYLANPPGGTVPTVSQWGLVVMVVLLMTAATVIFARRRVMAA